MPHRAGSVSKSSSPNNSAEWHILKYADRPKAHSRKPHQCWRLASSLTPRSLRQRTLAGALGRHCGTAPDAQSRAGLRCGPWPGAAVAGPETWRGAGAARPARVLASRGRALPPGASAAGDGHEAAWLMPPRPAAIGEARVPIHALGTTHGMLCVAWSEDRPAPGNDDVQALQAFALLLPAMVAEPAKQIPTRRRKPLQDDRLGALSKRENRCCRCSRADSLILLCY